MSDVQSYAPYRINMTDEWCHWFETDYTHAHFLCCEWLEKWNSFPHFCWLDGYLWWIYDLKLTKHFSIFFLTINIHLPVIIFLFAFNSLKNISILFNSFNFLTNIIITLYYFRFLWISIPLLLILVMALSCMEIWIFWCL